MSGEWIIDLDALEREVTWECPACRDGCVDWRSHLANMSALLERTGRREPRHERRT